eukprot:8368772-Karenia_brevis.AAC.1
MKPMSARTRRSNFFAFISSSDLEGSKQKALKLSPCTTDRKVSTTSICVLAPNVNMDAASTGVGVGKQERLVRWARK